MQSLPSFHPCVCFHSIFDLDRGQLFLVFILAGHTIKQMAHVCDCECDIQICCPLVEMPDVTLTNVCHLYNVHVYS